VGEIVLALHSTIPRTYLYLYDSHRRKNQMKFIYNNNYAAVNKNGDINFVDSSNYSIKEEAVLKNLNKFLINDYNRLIEIISKETKEKVEKAFYVMLSDEHFLFAVKKADGEANVKAFYKPENSGLLEMLKRLLKVEDKSGRVIISNIQNDFNFIAPKSILRVLFSANSLKANNIPLYREFKIKSKNGKIRNIVAPNEELKKDLQSLNSVFQYIFDRINADFQIAYKKDKNILDNAKIHMNKKFVYNVDLKDFYPSCKRDLVQKQIGFFFKNLFNGQEIESEFLDIVLHNDALFIGSPISGTLANVIISKAANYMKNISTSFGMEFSVYADDMTFSSDRFISRKVVEGIFNSAFTRYNLDNYFKLNEKKFHGMSNNRRRITGVSINHEDQPTVARNYYRELRVKIHKLSIGDTSNVNLQKLRGKIAFATMVDQSGKILRLIEKFETTVIKYKLVSDEKLKFLKNGGSN
jgi:hypothetical protein